MRFLVLGAALLCASVHADLVARQGSDSVRLLEEPCTDAEVLAAIHALEPQADDFQRAITEWKGKRYEGCWHPGDPGTIHVIYGDGQGIAPVRDLKDEQAI